MRVRLTKRNRNHSFAVLESVIEPSPSRIESDCSIFPECGGCSFRNISYEEELSVKTRLVREFRPLGEACGDFEVFSAAPDAYRTHVRIQFDGKQAGFFSLHSNRIVPLPSTGCANLPKELNSAIFGFIKKETRARTFAPRDLRFRISDKVYGPSHHGTVPIAIGSLTLDTPADGFVQANSMLIETWLKFIASLIGPGLPPALELYCGSGIIGAYVRENLGSYRAFDFNSSSIECARKNFSNSGLALRQKTNGSPSQIAIYQLASLVADPDHDHLHHSGHYWLQCRCCAVVELEAARHLLWVRYVVHCRQAATLH